jgi:hypothetical protein
MNIPLFGSFFLGVSFYAQHLAQGWSLPVDPTAITCMTKAHTCVHTHPLPCKVCMPLVQTAQHSVPCMTCLCILSQAQRLVLLTLLTRILTRLANLYNLGGWLKV